MAENLTDTNQEEHYIRRGDPSKPIYYIARPIYGGAGLFWHFTVFTGHIRYALSKGWLPVINMQNYPNAYLDPEKLGKENSWEYYFEQPLRIGLEQAYSSENVILSSISPPMRPDSSLQFTKENLTPLRNLVKQGFLKVKLDIAEQVSAIKTKLFSPTDRVLGVKLRGTDYVALKPKWHYIPPPYH